jgi:cell division protein YceG involved in septum cleavage
VNDFSRYLWKKEAVVAGERNQFAGYFNNRPEKNMPLSSGLAI